MVKDLEAMKKKCLIFTFQEQKLRFHRAYSSWVNNQENFLTNIGCPLLFLYFMSWLFPHVYLKTDSPMTSHGVEFIVKIAGVINDLSEIMDSYCY